MADSSQVAPSVRQIWRVRDLLRKHGRACTLVVLLVLVLGSLARGVYTLDNGESAARLRFGAQVDDQLTPGLRYRVPGGVEEVIQVRTAEVLRLAIEGDSQSALDLVTGDENLVEAILAAQYRIARLGDYLFSTESAEALVLQTIRAEMVEVVGALGVDGVLTSSKALIERQVRERSQEQLDRYSSGVTLISVNLQSVDPPEEAAGAFRDVLDARAEAAATLSRAQAEQDRALRIARGEAERLVGAAEAEAHSRSEAARGTVARFRDLVPRYLESPRLTRTDLRARTLFEVLPQTKMIVLPPGETPPLDVQLFESKSP